MKCKNFLCWDCMVYKASGCISFDETVVKACKERKAFNRLEKAYKREMHIYHNSETTLSGQWKKERAAQ